MDKDNPAPIIISLSSDQTSPTDQTLITSSGSALTSAIRWLSLYSTNRPEDGQRQTDRQTFLRIAASGFSPRESATETFGPQPTYLFFDRTQIVPLLYKKISNSKLSQDK